MRDRARAAAGRHPPGAAERIIAVGEVYLAFAIGEPALFRMMIGQTPNPAQDDIVTMRGRECFGHVLQEVVDYCRINAVQGDARLISLQLWTMVHGAASLTIDGVYAKVAPELKVDELLTVGAERLLFSLPRHSPN